MLWFKFSSQDPENESFETLLVLGGLEEFEALDGFEFNILDKTSKMKLAKHFSISAAWKEMELRS